VVRIEREGRELIVTTIGVLASKAFRLPVAQVLRAEHHAGEAQGASPATPWIALHVAGRRFPYLIDMKARTVNQSAIFGLAGRR